MYNVNIDKHELSLIIRNEVLKALTEFQNKEAEHNYLTRKEAAEYLRISLVKLWQLDKNSELSPIKVGGKVFYEKDAIDLFLRNKKG